MPGKIKSSEIKSRNKLLQKDLLRFLVLTKSLHCKLNSFLCFSKEVHEKLYQGRRGVELAKTVLEELHPRAGFRTKRS